jgi:hypothetical protein
MTDEQLPGETGADEATSTTDWEQRYKDTHTSWNELNERFSRFEKDPNALIEFIQEKHPDLLAEEDEETETFEEDDAFEDPRDQQIAQLEQRLQRLEPWQQDVEQERGERRFASDLKKEWGDEPIDPDIQSWIKDRTFVLGHNSEALKKAVGEWRALERKLKGEHIDEVTKSKKAPHVTAGGKAGTQVPTLDTHEDRRQFYRQRIAEKQSQQ